MFHKINTKMFLPSSTFYANTEAFLGRFKWIVEDANRSTFEESSDATVIQAESEECIVSVSSSTTTVSNEIHKEAQIVDSDERETHSSNSPCISPCSSSSACNLRESHQKNIFALDVPDNLDLQSFEVVSKDGMSTSEQELLESCPPMTQNNAFGDTALNVYDIASKTTSSVKSFFTSFLEESSDGSIVPVPVSSSIEFRKDPIVIGDIFSIAVKGLRAGASYLFGIDSIDCKDDTVHYRGYKVRTKGMELYLDTVHAKNNDDVSNRKVQFQFKLSCSHYFWQKKYEKKIISLPLKVYWSDHFNTTSMFIKVFDCEIEVEIPMGVPKDSIVVSCDPDKGTLTILAPSFPY